MRKVIPLLTLLFVCLAITRGLAQEPWELKKDEAGIKVYTRRLADEKLKEIRVLAELPGTPAQLKSVILDVANHKNWVYGLQETRVLRKIDENSLIYYNVADLPWPASNRDMVLQITASKDPASNQIRIRSRSLENYLPPQEDYVRVPYARASWNITPLSGKKMRVEYIFSVDPGGGLPAWLVNAVALTGPYNSFVELRKMMEKF